VVIYFKLQFTPGLKHASNWCGSLADTKAFVSTVQILFWQDKLGLGWGICQPTVWATYQQAMAPLVFTENQQVVQVTEFEVSQAVDPHKWSF